MSLIETPEIEKLHLPNLILASASPRRAEILNAVGWKFEKIIADIDETELENENPADYVCRLAHQKAFAVAAKIENGIVLGADTTVVLRGEIIGKPRDLDHARLMLEKLSGNLHEVLTGVCLVRKIAAALESKIAVQRTTVKFADLTASEIHYLVENGAPLDKAGAYAVQGVAALFIEEIAGDYWNVVGLPIQLVYQMMNENFAL